MQNSKLSFALTLEYSNPQNTIFSLGKVLKAALSIYYDLNHQPFPSMEEVVICTSKTSTEEVSTTFIIMLGTVCTLVHN